MKLVREYSVYSKLVRECIKNENRVENVQKLKQSREYTVGSKKRLESVSHVVRNSKINP